MSLDMVYLLDMEEHQISVVTEGYPDLDILIKAVSNVCGKNGHPATGLGGGFDDFGALPSDPTALDEANRHGRESAKRDPLKETRPCLALQDCGNFQ